MKQFHVLNGDALKHQFSKNLEGELIVTRECLVDGNVEGNTLEEFYATRAEFLSKNYGEQSNHDYYKAVVSEFQKIQEIPEDAEINLWFEDDLFCQVNFWFVYYLIKNSNKTNSIYLVRPRLHIRYGFGGLSEDELLFVYKNRADISDAYQIAKLWEFYQNNDTDKLLNTAKELEDEYPFILDAVKAHIERIPDGDNLGRPKQSLIQIMKDLKTEEFLPIFQEFCKREPIYGFGDLQVELLLKDLKNSN